MGLRFNLYLLDQLLEFLLNQGLKIAVIIYISYNVNQELHRKVVACKQRNKGSWENEWLRVLR